MKNTNGTYDYSCTRYDYSPVHAPFVDCWQVPVPGSAGGTGNGGQTIVASGGGGGGGAGGTNGKVVVAVYPFTAIEDGDLTLAKGEEYIVLDDSQDHWWEVRNKLGEVGFIPSNYVKEMDSLGLQNFDW